jgi:signal transduction histidine kinase
MKFWEKIFICTLIIFEIFFVPASVYLINSSFKLNLQVEVNSGISEQNRLCSFIESNLAFLKIRQTAIDYKAKFTKEEVNQMINGYLSNFKNENIYLQVLDEKGKDVFNNLNVRVPRLRPELNSAAGKLKYIIRDIDGETYLFIATKISLENNNYKFSYIKDVSRIYENRKYLLNTLFKLNIFLAIILVIVMIILSKFIVQPINKLIKSTKKIAEGNFSERVAVITDDEIGILSKNFNDMADVIEDKIHELKKNSDDKQRFIDDLTHELRTPLTSIIGYADFLRTAQYDQETFLNSLTYIYDEGKRLEKLSSKLMQLIVLRKEKFTMKSENTEALLSQVERAMTPKLKAKDIKLKVSDMDKFSLLMDIDLMTILITNLMDNAIKASKSGDEIYLSVYKDEQSKLIFEVKDTGFGIPSDEISKVFEPFYMVDKSRERANNGAGIGLALCSEIVKIHNGSIRINSEIGKGTIVLVIFQINQ